MFLSKPYLWLLRLPNITCANRLIGRRLLVLTYNKELETAPSHQLQHVQVIPLMIYCFWFSPKIATSPPPSYQCIQQLQHPPPSLLLQVHVPCCRYVPDISHYHVPHGWLMIHCCFNNMPCNAALNALLEVYKPWSTHVKAYRVSRKPEHYFIYVWDITLYVTMCGTITGFQHNQISFKVLISFSIMWFVWLFIVNNLQGDTINILYWKLSLTWKICHQKVIFLRVLCWCWKWIWQLYVHVLWIEEGYS